MSRPFIHLRKPENGKKMCRFCESNTPQYLLPGPPLVVVYVLLVCIYKSSLSPDTAQSGNNCSELQSSALPSVLA